MKNNRILFFAFFAILNNTLAQEPTNNFELPNRSISFNTGIYYFLGDGLSDNFNSDILPSVGLSYSFAISRKFTVKTTVQSQWKNGDNFTTFITTDPVTGDLITTITKEGDATFQLILLSLAGQYQVVSANKWTIMLEGGLSIARMKNAFNTATSSGESKSKSWGFNIGTQLERKFNNVAALLIVNYFMPHTSVEVLNSTDFEGVSVSFGIKYYFDL